MSNFIKEPKNYYLFVCILAVAGGILLFHYSNSYQLSSKTIATIDHGNMREQIVYMIEPRTRYIQLIGTIMIQFSVAIFISLFFVRYLESAEREDFRKKLMEFQEQTAKDAILSVFKRVIDPDFFKIISREVLNANLLRKNATWQYDIEKTAGGNLTLQRVISYELHNMSFKEEEESVSPVSQQSVCCSTKVVEINGEKVDSLESGKEGSFERIMKTIKVPPQSHVNVSVVMLQEFSTPFIYETHFTKYPIVNLQIIVNFPKEYVFSIGNDSLSSECKTELEIDGKRIYKVDGALYKGQGIEFVCQPK